MKFFNLLTLLLLSLPATLYASQQYDSNPLVVYQGMRHDGTHTAVLTSSNSSATAAVVLLSAGLAHEVQSSKVMGATQALSLTSNPAAIKALRERFESLSCFESATFSAFHLLTAANIPSKTQAQIGIIDSLYSDHVKAMTGASIKELLASKEFLTRTIDGLNCHFGAHNEFMRLHGDYQALQQRSLTNKPLFDFIPENMREIYLKKGIEYYEAQARLAGYEKCLKFNNVALQRIADQLKQVQEWNKQLPQAKALVLAPGAQLDQSMVKALGDTRLALQIMSKVITKEVAELLTYCQIPQEAVNKLIGSASQKYFFDKAHGIIADTAQLFARYKNDPHVCAYIKATALTSAGTIEMLRKSNVPEVIRHSQLSQILQAATHATINFSKGAVEQPLNAATGLGKGLLEVSAIGVVTAAAVSAFPAVGTGVLTMAAATAAYSLMNCDAKKIIDSINAFQKLPIEQQSQGIAIVVGSIYNPLTKNSYSAPIIQNLEKAIGRELVALSGLYNADQAMLVTHKGITFAKEFEHLLKPFIDSGKITTQADIIRHLEHVQAPFLTSFKEVVVHVAPAQVATAAAPKVELVAGAQEAAQVKAGQEAATTGAAGAQATQQQIKPASNLIAPQTDLSKIVEVAGAKPRLIATPENIMSMERLGDLSAETLEKAVKLAMADTNGIDHIFKKAKHNLGPLVETLGGHEQTIRAVLNATPNKIPAEGIFENIPIEVAGFIVYVRGNVIDGVPRLGTFFIKKGLN